MCTGPACLSWAHLLGFVPRKHSSPPLWAVLLFCLLFRVRIYHTFVVSSFSWGLRFEDLCLKMECSWGAWPSHLALLGVFSRLWPQNALLGHWTSTAWFCSCTVQWGFAASCCKKKKKKKFSFACGNSIPGLRFSLLDILILQPPVISSIPTSCCPGTQILTRSVPLSANLCYGFAVSLAEAAAYFGCFSSFAWK